LQCSVDDRSDPFGMELPNPFSHTRSSCNDLVSPESRDEVLVAGRGVGDHPEPVGFRQLYGVTANRTGGAGDRERLARSQVQHVESPAGGEPVHRQGGRLGVTASGGRSGDLVGVDDDVLGVSAAGVVDGHHDRHHAVADAKVGAGFRADLVDESGHLHARAVGR
jgi:hypothetical protein